MNKKIIFLIVSITAITGCYNSGTQNYTILHQPDDNNYTYKSQTTNVKNVVSGANLAAPKYMKHRRPQRRFIHGAYK